MKRQIRRGVFETNSSSTHSITMCMKSDYDRWENDNLFLYDGWGYGWEFNKPISGHFYTKDEVINLFKTNKYHPLERFELDDEETFIETCREYDFHDFDDNSDYLESFYEEFTTPSGEVVVAFGEYGYDG